MGGQSSALLSPRYNQTLNKQRKEELNMKASSERRYFSPVLRSDFLLVRQLQNKPIFVYTSQYYKSYQNQQVISSILGNNGDEQKVGTPHSYETKEKKNIDKKHTLNKGSSGLSSNKHTSNGSGFDQKQIPANIKQFNENVLKPVEKILLSSRWQSPNEKEALTELSVFRQMKTIGQNYY